MKRALIEGDINMPKDVYSRTNWKSNKGSFWHSTYKLFEEVNAVMVNSTVKMTKLEIHKALVAKNILPDDINGYHLLCWHLKKVHSNGVLNADFIADGRGHHANHSHSTNKKKFHLGDKVRIVNNQTPKWLRREIRIDNCRTIVKVLKTTGLPQYPLYFLGSNGVGNGSLEIYGFRSGELEPYTKKTTAGRPRTKRKYTRHVSIASPVQDSPLINPSESPSILSLNQNNNELVGVN
jgi:hypothetical protein